LATAEAMALAKAAAATLAEAMQLATLVVRARAIRATVRADAARLSLANMASGIESNVRAQDHR